MNKKPLWQRPLRLRLSVNGRPMLNDKRRNAKPRLLRRREKRPNENATRRRAVERRRHWLLLRRHQPQLFPGRAHAFEKRFDL